MTLVSIYTGFRNIRQPCCTRIVLKRCTSTSKQSRTNNWTRLSPNVVRITSSPFGPFSGQPSHTYLVGQGKQRILVDTGTGCPAYADTLQMVLVDEGTKIGHGVSVTDVCVTHAHAGHAGGLARVLDVLNKHNKNVSAADAENVRVLNPANTKQKIKDGMRIVTPDTSITLTCMDTTGHSSHHFAYTYDMDRIVFSGDAVHARPNTEMFRITRSVYDDAIKYVKSVDKIGGWSGGVCMVCGGHGEPIVYHETINVCREIGAQNRDLGERVLAMVTTSSDGGIATRDLVDRMTETETRRLETRVGRDAMRIVLNSTQFVDDKRVLEMLIKSWLRHHESIGVIEKSRDSVRAANSGGDEIKGPGGLTLTQVYSMVQKSREMDYKSGKIKIDRDDVDRTVWKRSK